MNDQLTVGGLFSGIGGWELGLERAGMRVLWHCEQDEFCQRVLARHWPGVPCHPDVRALVGEPEVNGRGARGSGRPDPTGAREQQPDGALPLPVPVPYVDVLCGGFPCQDLSVAGKGAGIDGARSGLWAEYARLIGELRPRYVLVENVSALLGRGLGRVLGDLSALGYDAEWDCIPASAVGAPHQRDRVWIVAYPSRDLPAGSASAGTKRERARTSGEPESERAFQVADTERERPQGHRSERGLGEGGSEIEARGYCPGPRANDWWLTEPDVGRVAHGIPQRVDRLRSLGNALVPQIAEWIGRRVLEWEAG